MRCTIFWYCKLGWRTKILKKIFLHFLREKKNKKCDTLMGQLDIVIGYCHLLLLFVIAVYLICLSTMDTFIFEVLTWNRFGTPVISLIFPPLNSLPKWKEKNLMLCKIFEISSSFQIRKNVSEIVATSRVKAKNVKFSLTRKSEFSISRFLPFQSAIFK